MTIVVTGTSGHLGRLTAKALLERGVPASDIVATARDTTKIADLAERGVTTARADYDDPASLRAAFEGADRLLLVSGTEIGRRVAQHRNVIDAAAAAGVGLVAYTSVLRADSTQLLLAAEHRATEEALLGSGLAAVLLRNGWYHENYTGQLDTHLGTGVVLAAAGEGKVSAAARRDYAEAAAVVLSEDGHAGRVYELGGDAAFTLSEYAATLSAVTGKEVRYQDVSTEEMTQTLAGFGIPEEVAKVYADSDAGVARGELLLDTSELSRLIGRPTTTLEDSIREALD